MKRKLKSENYKNWLEATKLENKISDLEKNKIVIDNIKKNYKEFIWNNKSVLKTQKDIRANSVMFLLKKLIRLLQDEMTIKDWLKQIDSIETNAYGMSKDLVSEKEEIKCNNITKQ